jgi:formylglycine-generating enzyme required for sulfatase activity
MIARGHLAAVALLIASGACAARQPAAPRAAAEPGMLLVGEGRFTMGRDDGELNEQPAHAVNLEEYAVDRFEVAAAEFAEFLNAAGNPGGIYFTPDERSTVVVARAGGDGGKERLAARAGYERHPANNVSWHGADAYCRWRGKRLPTEAEWEKAARGTDRRLYPWGDEPPQAALARFSQSWSERGLDVLLPVDALPAGASPYGLLHMAGNVLEWVDDWYRQNLCDFCNPWTEANLALIGAITGRERPDGSGADEEAAARARGAGGGSEGSRDPRRRQAPPRENPAGPALGTFKVLRGGSWGDALDFEIAATRRFWLDPAQRFAHTGFRCAKDGSREKGDERPREP